MNATLTMIRRIREIQAERGWLDIQANSGFPTLLDIKLGNLMSYLRFRHLRDYGHFSPI
jgi:hypothetical protein